MNKISKNYFYNLAYQILVLITPIITAPYLSRILGADNLGVFGYVRSSGSIISGLSLLGIFAYGTRLTAYVRDNKYSLTKAFWELEITHLLLCLLCILVYSIYTCFNLCYLSYFILYFPYIFAQFIDCSWVYIGLEDMRPTVIRNFIARLVNIIGIFVLVKNTGDLWIYIALLSVTTIIGSISIYLRLPKYIGAPFGEGKPKLIEIPKHIKGSIYLFLPQAALLLYLQVDKLMLNWMTGQASQVAYYDNAERIINIPLSVITIIGTVMMPRLANEFKKSNLETVEVLLLKAARYALLIAFPLMFGLICCAKQFIPWYLGDGFFPTANALMLLSPIVLFNTLINISGAQYFVATNQISILIKSNFTASALNIAVNALLIPRYGYIGASVATLFSSGLSVFIQYFYLHKQLSCKPVFKYSIIYLVGSCVMALAIIALTIKLRPLPYTTIYQIIIGINIYALWLFIIKDTAFTDIRNKLGEIFKTILCRVK